jgi:metal-dependent amidase/aminoacylase/carboxypeptidase family protein
MEILKNEPDKAVLIRTELDALPIEEETDMRYKSTKRILDQHGNEKPIMHACGHGINMAALLGASELLKAARSQLSGTLVTLFQLDEEGMDDAHNVPHTCWNFVGSNVSDGDDVPGAVHHIISWRLS